MVSLEIRGGELIMTCAVCAVGRRMRMWVVPMRNNARSHASALQAAVDHGRLEHGGGR